MDEQVYKTKCSNCGHFIESDTLTEVDFTVCDNCEEVVPVEGLYIASGPFFISRNDFIKEIDKYQLLLDDAYYILKEINDPESVARKEVTKEYMEILVHNLTNLFEGSRLNVRVTDISTPIEFAFMDVFYTGVIDNLSSTGVRIKFDRASLIQKKGYEIKLKFEDPKTNTMFIVNGRVAWIDKNKQMGVKFLDTTEETREKLHNYIMDKLVNKPPTD